MPVQILAGLEIYWAQLPFEIQDENMNSHNTENQRIKFLPSKLGCVMSPNSDSEKIKNYLSNFLDCYKDEISKLSEDEKESLQPNHDYTQPCQFEVFWLNDPSMQFILRTHFSS